jgi:hypothetical protein
MSTDTLSIRDQTLPLTASSRFEALVALWKAIVVGLAAARQYETLTARGMPRAEAAQTVFRDNFSR